MSDARRYAVWPEPRSRSLKGSRPSVPVCTGLIFIYILKFDIVVAGLFIECMFKVKLDVVLKYCDVIFVRRQF